MDGGTSVAANGAVEQSPHANVAQPVIANGNNHVQHKDTAHPNSATANKINKKKEKRKKKKQKKKERAIKKTQDDSKPKEPEEKVDIEYVRQDEVDISDPAMSEFVKIFEHFTRPENLTSAKTVDEDEYEEDEEGTEYPVQYKGQSEVEKPVLSKKARKRQKRLSIPLLKQLVKRPEVVEVHDVNSADPYFLVYLKSYRNSVPVPRHWSQKRKYLQGKRGIEKPPFQLPDFIAATGISKLRDAYQQKEDQKKLKQKQREKMQPKMGRVDIDYQVLHDAFFKFQTKPKLTIQGDLYYECKEFEVQLKEKRPGQLSDELKRALGMPEGAPPPWLINMQRYGPPIAYPNLKIPGLNAPIPPGASFGYHPGGWGKPPVNEFNQPLYGDVFGTSAPAPPPEVAAPIERNHWGELEEEEEREEEEEEEAEGEGEAPTEMEGEGAEGASVEQEAEIADGISSVPSGLETPDTIDLRKGRTEGEEPKLYQVLPQTSASTAGQMFGSSHKYIIGDKKEGASKANRVDLMKSQKTEDVNITLNPSDVEDMDTLSDDLLKKKYEQYIAEKADADKGEDFSDMVAEQNKKRKKAQKAAGDKKDKKFKF